MVGQRDVYVTCSSVVTSWWIVVPGAVTIGWEQPLHSVTVMTEVVRSVTQIVLLPELDDGHRN